MTTELCRPKPRTKTGISSAGWLALPLLALMLACPRDKKDRAENIPIDTAKADTTKTDLSTVGSAMPSAAPDTFKVQTLHPPAGAARGSGGAGSGLPQAPPELLAVVEREQGTSRFCFTEFGKKSDPSLRGDVTMNVTIGNGGVNEARVADSRWSGSAGTAVNRCLNERAERAWKVAPGAVKPGRYAVRLNFTS
jgi:hypothetical protein